MNGEVKFFCENSKKNLWGRGGSGRVGGGDQGRCNREVKLGGGGGRVGLGGLGGGVREDVTEK